MDFPSANPGYRQDQPWTHYNGWSPVMSPTNCPAGISTGPPLQPYHYPSPVAQHRPTSLYPPHPACTGALTPLPAASEKTQKYPEAHSNPNSPVESPRSESRYGLDPQLLPSAVQVMREDRAQWEGRVFISEPKSSLPPLSTTDCPLEDRGNATPRFIRSTTYCFPIDPQSSQQSRLPLGVILSPLAAQDGGEALSLCEASECVKGCVECGAFMCPAMSWQDCGQRFYCPFCGNLNEVPWQFYQPTDKLGLRLDHEKRAELSRGSYEIWDPQRHETSVLLLAIDVSESAIRSGELHFLCQEIQALLHSLNGGKGAVQSDARVGLLTYDSRIHLYDLSPALSRPHMLVITDTEDLTLPVREGLLVPLKDCIHIIDRILQEIPRFDPEKPEVIGSQDLPVSAGLNILLAAGAPGKLLVLHSSPVSENQDQQNSTGLFSSSRPKSIFQPPDSSISLAKMCVTQGCSVHVFVFGQQDVGGAWPGYLPSLTGGGLLCYSSLQSKMERERFSADLKMSVQGETAYRVQLKVFVSKGLRVSGCYGACIPGPDASCISMATLDGHTALAVEFTHSKPLDESRGVAIQVVLSYSTAEGERRTRVHCLTLQCSRHLLDTFRNCQAETLLTFLCKKTYCAAIETPLQSLREELQTEVTELLACYRKHCTSTSVSPGQLVLPQFLKALPVFVNSLRKSEVLLPGLRSTIHQRLQLRSRVVAMDTRSTVTHFYPLILQLSGNGNGDGVNFPSWERDVRCTASSFAPGRVFLAYSPLALLLWVGESVPSQSLQEIFNVSSFSHLQSGEFTLPVLENQLSITVRNLINTLQSHSPHKLKLKVVRQGDSCEEVLQHLLVEDKSPNGGASYADFVFHLHVNTMRLLV